MIGSKKAYATVGALGVGAALALMGPSIAAVGQESPPSRVDVDVVSATLLARGAAVSVELTLTCPSDAYYSSTTRVVVRQVFGRDVTTGEAWFTPPRCTDRPETLTVLVSPWGPKFKPGVALISAEAGFYTGLGFESDSDNAELRLSNR